MLPQRLKICHVKCRQTCQIIVTKCRSTSPFLRNSSFRRDAFLATPCTCLLALTARRVTMTALEKRAAYKASLILHLGHAQYTGASIPKINEANLPHSLHFLPLSSPLFRPFPPFLISPLHLTPHSLPLEVRPLTSS